MSGRHIALAMVSAVLGVLVIAPAGASAISQGCVQNGATVGTVSQWTCSVNPVTVSGYEVKQDNIFSLPKPSVNGHITHMEVDVVDGTGAPVPIDRLMLHHIVFFNMARPDAACGGPERFYGAGEERAKLSFPSGYGYPMTTDDSWFTRYMYMNHRPQTDSAWIQYKMTVDTAAGFQDLRSYWFDAGNCATDPIYNVPGIEKPVLNDCKKPAKRAKRSARKRYAKCLKDRQSQLDAAPTEATNVRTKDVTMKENGWIVAGAGHVHGGAKKLTLSKPSCNNLQVAESTPTWGNADHPFYNVKPVLHEPGPIGMSAFSSPTGIPVRQGQTIRMNSLYDDLQPHTRVMGIFIVYLATDPAGGATPAECGGTPTDITYGPGTNLPGRTTPVPFTVPLTGLDSAGNAVTVDGPPGAFKTLVTGDTINVGDRFFSEKNVTVTPGTTLNYRFAGNEDHNLTLANGPLGIGSADMRGGAVYSQKFDRPGTYRFFCGLHPVQMTERVVVENPQTPKKKKKKAKKAKRKKR